jgi:peptidoglycan/LPS O-acetylase OafA/YrhL
MIDFFPKAKYFIHLLTDFLNMDFHQFFYFFSALGAFSLIYIILSSASIQKFLSIKILTFLGKISFFERIVRIYEPLNNNFLEPLCSTLTLLILVVLISTLLFYTIEKPFLELSKYKSKQWFNKH